MPLAVTSVSIVIGHTPNTELRLLRSAHHGGLLALYLPWYCPDHPVLWWTPDPRMMHFPAESRLARSRAQTIRNAGLTTSVDVASRGDLRCPQRPTRGLMASGDA